MKPFFSVLDFRTSHVAALIARRAKDSRIEILGAGEAPAEGWSNGELSHLGDAVESVVQARKNAERSAGVEMKSVYYNFEDPHAQTVTSAGAVHLKGEGEIQRSDVDDACNLACRLAGRFEKNIVYSKELSFLIDDKDAVANPIGVFGRKLDVRVFIVQARSEYCQAVENLIKRCQFDRATSVLSVLSVARGVVPAEDSAKIRWIADMGRHWTNIFTYGRGGVLDLKIFHAKDTRLPSHNEAWQAVFHDFAAKHGPAKELLLTGEHAAETKAAEHLKEFLTIPVRQAAPQNVERLSEPQYAALAGLLSTAEESEKRRRKGARQAGLLLNVKEKAQSFISEYF